MGLGETAAHVLLECNVVAEYQITLARHGCQIHLRVAGMKAKAEKADGHLAARTSLVFPDIPHVRTCHLLES